MEYWRRPILILNPRDDRAFAAFTQSLLDGGATDPAVLQDQLRERYLQAVVRARELTWEGRRAWYVYRDGLWTPPP
jgi:hypothetical protein